MITKLSDLKPGDKAVIVDIEPALSNRMRLASMGLIPGIEITLLKIAPLGDPVSIRIKRFELSLRRKDAFHIFVEKNPIKEPQKVSVKDFGKFKI